jgi:hypothetical protein
MAGVRGADRDMDPIFEPRTSSGRRVVTNTGSKRGKTGLSDHSGRRQSGGSLPRRIWQWLDKPIDPEHPGIRFVRAFEGTAQRGPCGPAPAVAADHTGDLCPVCAAPMSSHEVVRTRRKGSMICRGRA